MSRYWVALPGRGKAVEMGAGELKERRARGDLPAGTLVARFGTKDWVSSDRVDELLASAPEGDDARTSLTGDDAAPPSSAVQGADAGDLPPDFAATIGGALDAPPLPAVATPEASVPTPLPELSSAPKSRTVVVVLASALVALIVSSSVFWAWFRYGYARGTVLEHIPTDCRRLEYVDFAAIDNAMKTHLVRRDKALRDWIEDLDDEDGFRRSQDDEAKGRASTLRKLTSLGLKPYGDVKEIALCEIRDGDETDNLIVVGGTFRGRDLPLAIREALIRRDRKVKDDRLAIEDFDGRPTLKIEENRYLMVATGQVAMIGKRKTITRYLQSKPAARAYGIRDDEVIVRFWAATAEGSAKTGERYSIRGGKLISVRTWQKGANGADEVKAIKDRLALAAARLRKLDGLDVLADAYDNVDVRVSGEEGQTEVSWPLKDVSRAMQSIYDADRRELRSILEAMRAAQATEFFHHAVVPGVDYFDLKLSPWPTATPL